jgi:hypothetical protein
MPGHAPRPGRGGNQVVTEAHQARFSLRRAGSKQDLLAPLRVGATEIRCRSTATVASAGPRCHNQRGCLVYGASKGKETVMKVFVAGGTGAMGRRLVPRLVAEGYEVVAMTRDASKAPWLTAVGAQPVIADALDRAAVRAAVAGAGPEVVIHQLTALSGASNYKQFDREFALTNRLRTEGTDHLLEGARAAGVRRFIAQSYGNWNYARTGSGLKTEQDPLDPTPPAHQKQSLAAIRYLESAVTGAEARPPRPAVAARAPLGQPGLGLTEPGGGVNWSAQLQPHQHAREPSGDRAGVRGLGEAGVLEQLAGTHAGHRQVDLLASVIKTVWSSRR